MDARHVAEQDDIIVAAAIQRYSEQMIAIRLLVHLHDVVAERSHEPNAATPARFEIMPRDMVRLVKYFMIHLRHGRSSRN
jgi:hypothetical protein